MSVEPIRAEWQSPAGRDRFRSLAQSRGAAGLCKRMESLGLVGRSAAMVDLYRWIDRASTASDLPVLITGETGTGKELVARAVHRLDPKRSRGPLVPVNCIALSSGIADSELFGHRRGSFTGAIDDHRGFFRTADRGVLFLDEIADLEPALQGKLLRVLQDGLVTAVGENREVAVSVRVIAATNKDLPSLIAEGRFRLDLLHRLAVLEVRLPPLSERRDDVALLVEHFVEKHASLRTRRLTAYPGFVEAIQAIALPGNVRQLENIVRRALAGRPDDDSLGVEDLPPQLLACIRLPRAFTVECRFAAGPTRRLRVGRPPTRHLSRVERLPVRSQRESLGLPRCLRTRTAQRRAHSHAWKPVPGGPPPGYHAARSLRQASSACALSPEARAPEYAEPPFRNAAPPPA